MFRLNLNFISPGCYSECRDVESLCTFCEIYITSRQFVFTNFSGKEGEFRMRTTTTDNEHISIKRAKLSFCLQFWVVPLENYLFTQMEMSSLLLKGSLFCSMLDTLMIFEQWGIFSVSHQLWHRIFVYVIFIPLLLLSNWQWSSHDVCLSMSGIEHTSFQM